MDREEIGSHQTSACGTFVKTMKEMGCEGSIIQTFDTATIHTANKEIDISLADDFCTIDYKKFYRLLLKQSDVKFIKAGVIRAKNSTVFTTKGDFRSRVIVDCTGWQATLADSLNKKYFNLLLKAQNQLIRMPNWKINFLSVSRNRCCVENSANSPFG